MTRLDVAPAELQSLAGRLTAVAQTLDARATGTALAIDRYAPGLGGDVAPHATGVGTDATDAAKRLVAAYRGLAILLSDSSGRYVVVDGGPEPVVRSHPDWTG